MRSMRYLIWLFTLAVLASALAGCGGGGGGGTATIPSTFVSNQPNAVQLTVDNGPASFTGYNVNRLFTSVTICESSSTAHCQTIDHVLVDTGSTGLRLLYTALDHTLNLNPVAAIAPLQPTLSGQPLLNCVQFADGSYAFGSTVLADVTLGPQTASNLPIQVIANPAYATLLPNCATGFTAINTVNDLGANGILGVGLYTTDCGTGCTTNRTNNYYYACAPGTCTTPTGAMGTTASLAQQLANPVAHFISADTNGVVIDLPAVPAPGTTSIIGQMLFGVGTQTNNATTGTTLLHTTSQGYINTVLSGATLSSSFIDSGSNGLYFGTNTLTRCNGGISVFYCPASDTSVNVTLAGTNAVSTPVTFVAGHAYNLFASGYSVLPTLSGPIGNTTSFDWGLPFFYGRRVFFGIEGRSTPLGNGPLVAF